MADDLMKKMLRAVLQSNKHGVSITRLQSDFRSLTGDFIPHKQLGYPSMEGFLRSIPSVVKMENRMGELVCIATACQETAHIAQLVARQKTSKKPGRSQMVNCQMRVKPSSFMFHEKPRTSLRQPSHYGRSGWGVTQTSMGTRPRINGGYGGFGSEQAPYQTPRQSFSQHNNRFNPAPQHRGPITQMKKPPVQCERPDKRLTLPSKSSSNYHKPAAPTQRPKAPQQNIYNQELVQSRLTEVLTKYCSGLWQSKLPTVYREMFNQELHGQAVIDLENWTHICSIEQPGSTNRADRLIYPPQSKAPSIAPPVKPAITMKQTTPTPLSILRIPAPNPVTPRWSFSSSAPTSLTLPSPKWSQAPTPASPPAATVPPDVCLKLKELLSKYSHGLWAHALPKLFLETYKTPFPEHVLANLSLLLDMCTVEYPLPDNKKKAILYGPSTENKSRAQQVPSATPPPSVSSLVPPLVQPEEQYPSVLVVEASTKGVIIRYIGERYSQAQEAMENAMRLLYSQVGAQKPLINHAMGKLAAVRVEGGEEVVRAQVGEVMNDSQVKVYYVDHGFSEVISKSRLLELHKDFFKLPFQAASCRLAGLERFMTEPAVLKTLESLAVGKILLLETLGKDETLVVLYDTSHDDDVNVNAACLLALQDKSMANPLQVNSTYVNVCVTNVCSDQTIFCQLPSRGQVKLNEILEKIEAFFISQITNLHGSRVLDIRFVDLGVPASVEVIELREIPTPFLHELMVIPHQAIKCCLEDLAIAGGAWPPEAVLWLRDAVHNAMDCSMKISKLDEAKLVHIYLFTSKGTQDVKSSVNHQMAHSDLWKRLSQRNANPLSSEAAATAGGLTKMMEELSLASPARSPVPHPTPAQGSEELMAGRVAPTGVTMARGESLQLPPLMELPQMGQNMDIYVSVACHPGHFVLQAWQDLYKLVVLMGEMILYYNKTEERTRAEDVRKGEIYAAKVENNWHRVLVKGLLLNGLVSVYELDYGKHELVSCTQLRPLIEEFRHLPFQGITAQLAGVEQRQWSEAASIVFRNHVEKRALVAQIESVQEAALPWDRKVTVFLVDTSKETDVWVHNIMAEFPEELSTAA